MSTTWALLRDGLRLAILLRPKRIVACASPRAILILLLLQALASLPVAWLLNDAPRTFDPSGIAYPLVSLAISLGVASVLAGICRRPELILTTTAWQLAASLPAWVAYMLLLVFGPDGWTWEYYWIAGSIWAAMVLLRIGQSLTTQAAPALFGACVALLVLVPPWWFVHTPDLITTDWPAVEDERDLAAGNEADTSAELPFPEATMYAQPELLDRALQALVPQRPGRIDLFVLGFAGDAAEGAFRNEIDFLPELAANRFDAAGHSLRLVNHPGSAATLPLATVTNLERALQGIARRMDVGEDILLLYLSSHGSEDHLLYVNQPPLPLRQLSPQRLRVALDEAGIRWRVIVVSACYSGGFIDPLRGPETLLITAAAEDRTSFGCGNSANATWFGQSFLIDGLNFTSDFHDAFRQARKTIAQREQAEGHEASQPQWSMGEAIAAHLAQWRETLPEGHVTAFVPSVRVVDEADDTASAPARAASLDPEAE